MPLGPLIVALAVTSTSGVVVRDHAPGRGGADPSASTTELGAERLARARRTGEELGALVDTVAGARALDFGGPLAARRVGIRGGSAAQTLVLLDDVPLRMPFATGPDLDLFSAEGIDRVEVSRGGRGAAFGEGALSGAVSLHTRRARADEQSVTLGYGSFGTAKLSGAIARRPLSVSASWETTSGDFDYTSRILGLPDEERVRRNNDGQRGRLGLRVSERFGSVAVDVTAAGAYREAGVPGLEATPAESLTARETQRFLFTRAGARTQLDLITVSVGASATLLDIDYADPSFDTRSATRFVSAGGDVGVAFAPSEDHRVDMTLTAAGELTDSDTYGSPSRPRISWLVSDRLVLEPFSFYAAARIEAADRMLLLPRVGVAYALTEALELRLGGGRSARFPTLDELYHPFEIGFSGNPELQPEQAWELEAGAHLALGPFFADAAGFVRVLDNAILYINRDAFVIRPESSGEARVLGGELELGFRESFGDTRLGANMSASALATRLEATGEVMPGQPNFLGAADLTLGWGPLDVTTTGRFFSSTFVTIRPTDGNEVPAYFRWDATVSAMPFSFLTASAAVLNLLDERSLMSIHRIPLPGRTLLFTLRFATEET